MIIAAMSFALCGLTLAEDSVLSFTFKFDEPEIKTVDGITYVSMKGLHNKGNTGEPVLPLKQIDILLPFGKIATCVEASGEKVVLPGEHLLEWGGTIVPLCGEAAEQSSQDPAIYNSNDLFPFSPAESLSLVNYRGYDIHLVHLYPVQYQPLTGILSYWKEIDLKVHLRDSAASEANPLYRGLEKDKAELSRRVVNPESNITYPSAPSPRSFNASPLTSTAEAYDHVIITPSAFASTFQRFADYKNSIGVTSTIVTTEEIFNNSAYDGVDESEAIRNFIIDAYQSWGITYVLLGGDDYNDSGTLLVPERGCWLAAGGSVRQGAASDIYFGALDGNWNDDGDGNWCEADEIDYYPEVHVGRVTAETINQINNWIDKDLFYEQNLGHSHQNKALWLGEKLDAFTYGSNSKEQIIPVFTEDYVFTKLYDKNGNYSKQNCINEMNNGPHFVNHLGHAYSGNVEKLTRSDIGALTNDFYFLNYSQGCDAGGWDQDFSGNSESVSEHFIFDDHGAFAVLMNSRFGWYSMGGTNGPSQKYDKAFFDAIFQEDIRNIGAANDDSKMDNAGEAQNSNHMRWCFLEINLHGDPHTAIHYQVPEQVTGLTFENNKQAMNWEQGIQSGQYDVVKGDLMNLISSGGDFTSSLTDCLENDSPDTQAYDSDDPLPGEGFYYLVRGQNGSMHGSFNTGQPSQIGDRDFEIEASPECCP
jgi:hypothetical protein